MFFPDLQQFIASLESSGELTRVAVETDPILEIAAITNRVCKHAGGGPALLFEQPGGYHFKLAANLFGSSRRIALALGLDNIGQLTGKMATLLDLIPRVDINRLDRNLTDLPEFSCYAPRVTSTPAWTKIMDQPDLSAFPFLQSWPEDGAASGNPCYITLPQVFTVSPDGSRPNCGMYRAQVHGKRELAIQWKAGSGAAQHLEDHRRQGSSMPVAIALGGPPAALFSSMLPLPGILDEMSFAGFLSGRALELAPCQNIPLRVPASAEVVIEGYVDSSETVLEGPFGNHTGFYSPAAPAVLMRVTAISHRPNAIIPATVVGPPPMEDCWMAQAWERLLLAFLRKLLPAVAEIHFPLEWVFHQSAIISLESSTPGMVREIAARLWDTPWFSQARLLVFVAADTFPADLSRVSWRCINLADASRDLLHDASGKRVALDATGCREVRHPLQEDLSIQQKVTLRWQEYGIGVS